MNRRNWLASAGLVYVVVWVIGLMIESDTPGSSASATELTAYFATHQSAHLIQSYLIDGIAGIALLVFTASLVAFFQKADDNTTLQNVILGAGIAAGSVSLVQAGLQEVLINRDVLTAGGELIRMLLVLINTTDTFKLLALALLSGGTSALNFRTHSMPQWLGWLGVILSLTLIIGGLNFILNSPILLYVLFVSLPLLLLWVGGISVVILRRVEATPSTP